MNPATDAATIERALAPLRDLAPDAAILCDIDGTLAPIANLPGEARVPAATRELLRQLAERYRLVACISGRRAREARELVGLADLHYVGNHGFEALPARADETVPAASIAGREGRVAAFVASLDRSRLDQLDLRIEDKGPIQALHWRGAASEPAAELGAREFAATARGAGLEIRWGRKVLEIRPVSGIDKGTAVHALLIGSGLRGALYIGDDETDLDAFAELRRLASSGRLERAVCAGVASQEGPAAIAERADVVADGPDGVAEALELLLG